MRAAFQPAMMRKHWAARGATIIGAAILLGIVYQQWGEAQDAKNVPPPGRLISVGDHRLHIWCSGVGQPTVVMLSGGGTPSVTLYAAQTQIARFTRVCTYDRAGLGWSDPPSRLMGLSDMADDLHVLLTKAKVTGPYILAPESFGGLVGLTYAKRYPADLAGVVFIDASEPSLWFRVSPQEVNAARRNELLWQIGWHLGIIRAFLPLGVPSWVDSLSPKQRAQFDAVWSKPIFSYANEWIGALRQTRIEDRPTAVPGMLGDLPIIVIRHGQRGGMGMSPAFERAWPAAQQKLAELSSDRRLIFAKSNHHQVAEENPQLVTEAVRLIVAQVRAAPPQH